MTAPRLGSARWVPDAEFGGGDWVTDLGPDVSLALALSDDGPESAPRVALLIAQHLEAALPGFPGDATVTTEVSDDGREIVVCGPAETSPTDAPGGETDGEPAGAGSPSTLTPGPQFGAGHHHRTSTIVTTLRQVANAIAALGDRPIPTTSLDVGLQVLSSPDPGEAKRIATVDLLCAAIGTTGRHHEMTNGTWHYDEADDRWDGDKVDVYTAVTAPTDDADALVADLARVLPVADGLAQIIGPADDDTTGGQS